MYNLYKYNIQVTSYIKYLKIKILGLKNIENGGDIWENIYQMNAPKPDLGIFWGTLPFETQFPDLFFQFGR